MTMTINTTIGITANSLTPLIGRNCLVLDKRWKVECVVEDAKERYGRTDLLVRPLDVRCGVGVWVDRERCEFDKVEVQG